MPIQAPSMTRPIAAIIDLPFDEAIASAEARNVQLPAEYYDQVQAAARARAFTVSHLSAVRQIRSVLDKLVETLREGLTFLDFSKRVKADQIDLSLPHRETVFRTGVQTAYNAGRRTQQVANADNRQYLMYDAINDSRTRPTHRAMDGFIAPVADEIWRRWTPPAGYSCRCSCISLTERQARARGYTGFTPPPPVEPDPGWGHDPSERAAQAQRIAQALADAQADLPPEIQRASGAYALRAARDAASGSN